MRRLVLVLATLLPIAAECEQSYKVYTDHPRLWLDARRLRLLRRERERDSIRWQQLQLLLKDSQPLPEEALVRALEYQVAGNEESGRRAVAWALARASAAAPEPAELRRLAVVFDWCHALLSEAERAKLAARIASGIGKALAGRGLPAFSSGVLAAIALADDWTGSEPALTQAFEKRWRAEFLPAVRSGSAVTAPADAVALIEMCHATQDNLNLDLWIQAPVFFRQFPIALLLGYYPPPIEIDGHRFRRPAELSTVKSDPAVQGELARVAEMLTAAYETNSVETQFLQGWITHDIYRLRTLGGALYEFLWMNPYQPGLSYYNVPLWLHDEVGGRLLARSSWDDDATWIGYFQGELQLFADDKRSLLSPDRQTTPIVFAHLAVLPARGEPSFRVTLPEGEDVFVLGLEGGRTYWVKKGEAKFVPQTAAAGGILHIEVQPGVETAIELKLTDPNPPPPTLDKKKKK